MLKLLGGLVAIAYKCKPDAPGLAAEIKRDMEPFGIHQDDGTNLKLLRMAAEEVGDVLRAGDDGG